MVSARLKTVCPLCPFFAFRLKRFVEDRHKKRRNPRLFFRAKKKSPLPFWQGTFLINRDKKQKEKTPEKGSENVIHMCTKRITNVYIMYYIRIHLYTYVIHDLLQTLV
ncbi:hypothetical protein BTEBP_320009 [Brochothrix thermosphacta]|nr:hypothetical protein BTEBP_320009 [Brochothrix thermosphacta]